VELGELTIGPRQRPLVTLKCGNADSIGKRGESYSHSFPYLTKIGQTDFCVHLLDFDANNLSESDL
jgi:hypothetical protein